MKIDDELRSQLPRLNQIVFEAIEELKESAAGSGGGAKTNMGGATLNAPK